jgi:hypothetical protein
MANKKVITKQVGARLAKCAFQVAIENTEEVKNGFCVGKQAIKSIDRSKVVAAKKNKLQGSLDIDSQVKVLYPNEPRWDYALSYDNKVYYFEVHPAETSEVDKVVNKVKWLKCWLKSQAPEINKLPKAENPYIWVQSGRYAILPTSKEKMKLSVSGITTANILSLK